MSSPPSRTPPRRSDDIRQTGFGRPRRLGRARAPVAATDLYVTALKGDGYAVSDALDSYLDADLLAATDLVVRCWTMGEITGPQVEDPSQAVLAGTGLAGRHGGIVDAFRAETRYHMMTDGQFVHEATGVRVGCAPDTVLGTGVQSARAVLDAGRIGTPVAATAFMVTPGHERWHPAPEFYYRPGGGPLFDMGPYYLTALVTLLGPVRKVVGMASTSRPVRTVGSGPRAGTEFPVEVATHVTGVLEHEGGALSTLVMSFDVWAGDLPRIEVYGTGGSLSVPDPNGFDGPVRLFSAGAGRWENVPVQGGYAEADRGYGIADLARALATGTPHRASGQLAHHVLEIMESLLTAAENGRSVTVTSAGERPAAVPARARPEAE